MGQSLPMLPGVRPLISFLHDGAIGLATGGRGWRHCCPVHDVYVVAVLLYFLKYLQNDKIKLDSAQLAIYIASAIMGTLALKNGFIALTHA